MVTLGSGGKKTQVVCVNWVSGKYVFAKVKQGEPYKISIPSEDLDVRGGNVIDNSGEYSERKSPHVRSWLTRAGFL